ncbi:hypothetical protein P152DRAFT_276512 [Eremomyces bilateralis CBS 781.70]|uniref:Uncharacterized protein n=1 Tax=Eremomyces bilateralis CBS 781.70 TaxID=1392243 RepID=A0A6G1G9A6_9PEZI|nr:uncharacterized protein P152DRAFT_276512 [Eremomyces bilateralis CBS 781.70]KAF1814516.1 hypothetical protein P152DRAFT_276512 [Eremomyces bilateralis CBS 781.70]
MVQVTRSCEWQGEYRGASLTHSNSVPVTNVLIVLIPVIFGQYQIEDQIYRQVTWLQEISIHRHCMAHTYLYIQISRTELEMKVTNPRPGFHRISGCHPIAALLVDSTSTVGNMCVVTKEDKKTTRTICAIYETGGGVDQRSDMAGITADEISSCSNRICSGSPSATKPSMDVASHPFRVDRGLEIQH